MSGFDGWYTPILYQIKAPLGPDHCKAMKAWQKAEGGTAKFNPLNTTYPWAGATNYNDIGVKNYKTRRDGIDATVSTLLLTKYAQIVYELRKPDMDFRGFAKAVGDSEWGSSEQLILEVLGLSP